jgi:hypothetical protein
MLKSVSDNELHSKKYIIHYWKQGVVLETNIRIQVVYLRQAGKTVRRVGNKPKKKEAS